MNFHHISFSGAILERGFWLYVWRIRSGRRMFFYVGRTGDSSSKFAASPFSRMGQHLDVRQNAAANMVLRHVHRLGLNPLSCNFELIVLGPLFPEQATLELHRKFRNRIAPLEVELAAYLREKGFEVVGKHTAKNVADPQLLAEVQQVFDEVFAQKSRDIT